jgi:hypothetical protein
MNWVTKAGRSHSRSPTKHKRTRSLSAPRSPAYMKWVNPQVFSCIAVSSTLRRSQLFLESTSDALKFLVVIIFCTSFHVTQSLLSEVCHKQNYFDMFCTKQEGKKKPALRCNRHTHQWCFRGWSWRRLCCCQPDCVKKESITQHPRSSWRAGMYFKELTP